MDLFGFFSNYKSPAAAAPAAYGRSLEASHLEIALLALFLLALTTHMISLGRHAIQAYYDGDQQPPDLRHGRRPSRPYLWNEVFSNHPPGHGLVLQGSSEPITEKMGDADAEHDRVGFVERLRKGSGDVALAAHRELASLRRRISAAGMPDPFMADVECGMAGSVRWNNNPGFRAETSHGAVWSVPGSPRRRSSVFSHGLKIERGMSMV